MASRAKRGQAAAGAAVLLAIIAGLLIMFIILMPPQERAELLGEKAEKAVLDAGVKKAAVEKNLLTASPGRIDYLAQREIEHPLPVINVYTRTEARVLAEKTLAQARKGIFSEDTSEFSFEVPDLENTENVFLNFKVRSSQGRLIIQLNGEELFDAEAGEGSVPLHLPQNALRKENKLNFAVSSPGIAFWRTNEVSLEELKIVADVTSLEAQSAKNIFLISETEKRNLEKVVLKFQPQCNNNEVGPLVIAINGNEVYNAVPDCDLAALVPIEFSPELARPGENEIVFQAERGTYLLSHVMILSQLKEVDFPTYYFDLSHEDFLEVKNEKKRVRLTLEFVEVVASKYGDIVFNGQLRHFDTKEAFLTLDLSGDVAERSNSLKIKPKKTVEIRELRVDLVK